MEVTIRAYDPRDAADLADVFFRYMEVGKHLMLACRQGYIPDLAALFTEDGLRDHGYVSIVDQLRDWGCRC